MSPWGCDEEHHKVKYSFTKTLSELETTWVRPESQEANYQNALSNE